MNETRALQPVHPAAPGGPLALSDSQIDLIKRTIAKDATDDELELFLYTARRLGLDPLARQLHFVKRQDKMTIQTGIDGYRLIAERTGSYAGNDDPVFAGGIELDGQFVPEKATVTVWKIVNGQRCPFVATARWVEYYPGDKLGWMWRKMPHLMLAKCFDEETEVLTDQGFQRFSEVTGHILQVTSSGLLPTNAKPFVQEYSGPMVTCDSDDLNFCVTPNHDMVTTEGKISAGQMYELARTRPQHWIPRCVEGTRPDLPIPDDVIRLAAAYLADGSDGAHQTFKIEVSRPHKVAALRALGLHESEQERLTAGDVGHGSTRTIVTRANKTRFVYRYLTIGHLCTRQKEIRTDTLLALSKRQARVFVDAWIAFDGTTGKDSGVRRFYTSRPDHLAAFEVACAIAGYSVSRRRTRLSDIGTKPNFWVTVSSRSEIPIIRWGRAYNNRSKDNQEGRTGLSLTENLSGRVWCVTVPSGVIVVRRNGFSMQCGNCAEALALRKAFPAELSGIYTDEEMDQAGDPVLFDAVVEPRASGADSPRRLPAGRSEGNQRRRSAAPTQPVNWTTFWQHMTKTESMSQNDVTAVLGMTAAEYAKEHPELGTQQLIHRILDLRDGVSQVLPADDESVTSEDLPF